MQIGPCLFLNCCLKPLVGVYRGGMQELTIQGGGRLIVGGWKTGEHHGVRAHPTVAAACSVVACSCWPHMPVAPSGIALAAGHSGDRRKPGKK
jgi:hypothetical protein